MNTTIPSHRMRLASLGTDRGTESRDWDNVNFRIPRNREVLATKPVSRATTRPLFFRALGFVATLLT